MSGLQFDREVRVPTMEAVAVSIGVDRTHGVPHRRLTRKFIRGNS
jgi:hypothetical protein